MIVVIVRRQVARNRHSIDAIADAVLLQYVMQVRSQRRNVDPVVTACRAQERVLVDKNKWQLVIAFKNGRFVIAQSAGFAGL